MKRKPVLALIAVFGIISLASLSFLCNVKELPQKRLLSRSISKKHQGYLYQGSIHRYMKFQGTDYSCPPFLSFTGSTSVPLNGNNRRSFSEDLSSTSNVTTLSTSSSSDDSNDKEVGVYWINKYPERFDLSYSDDETEGFYDTLGNNGWTKRFNRGNSEAKEKYFAKNLVGGADSSSYGVDTVDFAYFDGHGGPGEFCFSTNTDGDGSHEKAVHYTETLWGDTDLEWITITACETLRSDYRGGWYNYACENNHLHSILGFHSPVSDLQSKDLGETFAYYLYYAGSNTYTIGQAWRTATKEALEDGTAAIIYPKVYYVGGSEKTLYRNYYYEYPPDHPTSGPFADPSIYNGFWEWSVEYHYASWTC